MHIFLKCTWNILQDKPYIRPQVLIHFKKIEIIQSSFSNHNGIKLDINNRRKTGKFISLWKLTNGSKKKISGKLENTKTNENKTTSQNLQDAAKPVLKGKFRAVNTHT